MEGKTPQEKSVRIHTILYVPMGIIEFIFLYLIVVNIVSEEDNKSKNILNILLHSSLSRMFIAISVIVWFPNAGVPGFIRRFLWRIKGYLGIIFLVDLLLLRIEIDNSKITDQSEKIKRINLENSIENTTRMYQAAAVANANFNTLDYSPDNYSPTNYSQHSRHSKGSISKGRFGSSPYSPNGISSEYPNNSREKLINTPTTPSSRYGIPISPSTRSPMNESNSPNHFYGSTNDRVRPHQSGHFSVHSGSAVSIENPNFVPSVLTPNIGEITDINNESHKYAIYEEAKRLYK
ncbi:hypothetical protein PIROE2DRAFT_62326 [Piromyces sp. E2]|nr:hypothetical protein PIROE2DRAFT_62326 [Piromyces sp. E2]|eukprot:OUM61740.1 hypothetical protein PIROE2DRAFT_62326 [Piromyces sp. E2]